MYTLYSLCQSDEWLQVIQRMPEYDFYDTPEYHRLDTSGNAVLFVYEEDETAVCLPMILREIPGTNYKDVTSVYGYAGPLISNPEKTSAIGPGFRKNLDLFFCREKVVSVFSRLNPLRVRQSELLQGLGETHVLNQTVFIDLALSQEAQWSTYSESLRRQVRRIAEKGIETVEASSAEEWLTFGKIYNASMRRRNAGVHYFFPDAYFLNLRNARSFKTLLLVSRYQGEIIAGGLFTLCNGTMQYHLGAVKSDYISFSPLKILLDEARRRGCKEGMRIFHLGGGYGGEDSPLLAFKSRFSPLRKDFKIWKYCTNEEAYTLLVKEKSRDESPTEEHYFPLYRFI